MLTGGIDLGGSKVEAQLFDSDWCVVKSRRDPTPEKYEDLLDLLADQLDDLDRVGDHPDLPVGIGFPGVVDTQTGSLAAANLCANGKPLPADIAARLGRTPTFIKDCHAFALSEAILGAGRRDRSVFGLVIGTGIGGAQVLDDQPITGANGIAGEIGHLPLSASLVAAHGLPILPCGCGRSGCFETLASGPGLSRLALHVYGESQPAETIAAEAARGTGGAVRALDLWFEILADLVDVVDLAIDPDCIVLGGGMSAIPQAATRLESKLMVRMIPGTRPPRILMAEGGTSSGARGAALAARRAVRS